MPHVPVKPILTIFATDLIKLDCAAAAAAALEVLLLVLLFPSAALAPADDDIAAVLISWGKSILANSCPALVKIRTSVLVKGAKRGTAVDPKGTVVAAIGPPYVDILQLGQRWNFVQLSRIGQD
eukprot:CAMPEP_0198142344 /NCGR_PEP_ID=MMETSP1443-20131203/5149_1 /TAXON_ID=186043 /ORGANISM="Entomoneis sp., Strain CCMP2396" /LENGTH=123 /DNA_ID=CAMNT_0043805323 /DNA_START=349 /DNA_END=716 /DNA_ORIENTATION=+